jgi:hypothetical protein
VDDALDVLSDLSEWRLSEARWEEVERVVATMQAALAAGDSAMLGEATADLELLSPIRITRVGATPTVPAPERVRERRNQLEQTLVIGRRPSQSRDTETANIDGSAERR